MTRRQPLGRKPTAAAGATSGTGTSTSKSPATGSGGNGSAEPASEQPMFDILGFDQSPYRGIASGVAEAFASRDMATVPAVTEPLTPDERHAIERLYDGIPPDTPTSDESGSTTGSSASASESPNSATSEPPSRPLRRRWRTPKNAMEFASQARRVMTMYLNGEMSREEVTAYSSVARTVAQALSTEVTRARSERQVPELEFDNVQFEDEEDDDGD